MVNNFEIHLTIVLTGKIMSRLEYRVTDDLVDNICKCKAGAIEMFLIQLRNKVLCYAAFFYSTMCI